MNPALCAGLLTMWPPLPSLGDDVPRDSCAVVDVDLAGRASVHGPDAAIPRRLSLARSRVEGGLVMGPAVARVAVVGARSAPEGGYVGVEGEALLPVLQIAEARASWVATGLTAWGGLVDDPWVARENATWGFRQVGLTASEAEGLMDRSDLGMGLGWAALDGAVQLGLVLSSGEGARQRERNDGMNTALTVTLRPLEGQQLVVDLLARDGSRSASQARDHRLGLRVWHRSPVVGAGASVLGAAGVQGDAARRPWLAAAWANATPGDWAVATLRYEHLFEPNAAVDLATFGLGVQPRRRNAPVSALVVASVRSASAGASGLPDTATTAWSLGLQLGLRGRLVTSLTPVQESP